AATTLQAQRLEQGTAELFSEHIFFRGQSDVAARLLPTKLRGPWQQPKARERISIADTPMIEFNGVKLPSVVLEGGDSDHWGSWYETDDEFRSIEDSMSLVNVEELARRDALEANAIASASRVPEIGALDQFRQRAAVRHYSGVFSPLL